MNRHKLRLIVSALAWVWIFPGAGFGQPTIQGESTVTLKNLSASIADIVKKVGPSVVQVRTIGYGTAEGQELGWVVARRGTGSGVILDGAGFIVTNAHVVKGASN